MSEDRERAREFKVGDWVIYIEEPHRAFKIMDVLQGPGKPPRFYYNEDGDAYRANELTPLSSAGRDEEWAKAAGEYLDAEDLKFGLEIQTEQDVTPTMMNQAHNRVVKARDALAALVEEKG